MATNQQNFRVRNGLTIDGATTGSSNFANAATGADINYVLPTTQGAASTALTNDGSGNLTWALPGGGGSTFGNITVGVVTDNTISTTTGNLILDAGSSNYVEIDNSNTSQPTYISRTTANTTSSARSLTLLTESTGTPGVGFGNLLEWQLEAQPGNIERAAYINVGLTDSTVGSEDFRMDFGLMRNGAAYDSKLALFSNGDIDMELGGKLAIKGLTNGYSQFGAPATGANIVYVLPGADGTNGYVLSTNGSGTLSWVANPDTNTTYTQDASVATGGANLNLVGSDSTTDTIKFAGGTNVTITATDANTITIDAPDTNTTYDFNATSATGGANLNLVGSDATTDSVKLSDGGHITAAYTSATEITLGSDATDTNTASTIVARNASGDFSASGATLGNITVGVATNNTIASTDTNGNIILSPNGTGRITLDSDIVNIGDGAATSELRAYTNTTLRLSAVETTSGATSYININNGANANIEIAPNGTGDVHIYSDNTRFGDNNATATLSTYGTGNLVLTTHEGSGVEGNITLTNGANGNITLSPNGTGIVIVSSDLAVDGGDITTTQTTASVFNTTATTVNAFGAATTAVNIGTANGSILKGSNRSPFTSPTITAFQGSTAPSSGLLLNNGNGASAALARNTLLLRTYPTTGSARGALLFENARGTENVPTAVVGGDLMAEINATGYATNGFISDYVAAIPALSFFTATENWANTGGPYPTAGTVTNSGTGYILSLQPTATNLSSTSRISVLSVSPQTFACRSDAYTWSNGKSGTSQKMSLNSSGDLTVNTGSMSTNGAFDQGQLMSANATLLDTNTVAGGAFGITTKYKPSSGSATFTVPLNNWRLGSYRMNSSDDTAGTNNVLASQLSTKTTENWVSGTNNGTAIELLANKKAQSWTTGHMAVASLSPEDSYIVGDITSIRNSAGTDYAVLNSTSATFTQPVGFPVKTAAAWNAITGAVGQQVSVSDSPTSGGRMAFWDTTNTRWSYISDNSAV